ncbi:hypothetical protein ABK040_005856 [Willaertia magna]
MKNKKDEEEGKSSKNNPSNLMHVPAKNSSRNNSNNTDKHNHFVASPKITIGNNNQQKNANPFNFSNLLSIKAYGNASHSKNQIRSASSSGTSTRLEEISNNNIKSGSKTFSKDDSLIIPVPSLKLNQIRRHSSTQLINFTDFKKEDYDNSTITLQPITDKPTLPSLNLSYSSSQQQDIIELNVGGNYFTTSSTTLFVNERLKPQSKLYSLLKYAKRDVKNRIFLDRDGLLFGYILNYLRDGEVDLRSLNKGEITNLRKECKYYRLDEFLTMIDNQTIINIREDGCYVMNDNDDGINSSFSTMSEGTFELLFDSTKGIVEKAVFHKVINLTETETNHFVYEMEEITEDTKITRFLEVVECESEEYKHYIKFVKVKLGPQSIRLQNVKKFYFTKLPLQNVINDYINL